MQFALNYVKGAICDVFFIYMPSWVVVFCAKMVQLEHIVSHCAETSTRSSYICQTVAFTWQHCGATCAVNLKLRSAWHNGIDTSWCMGMSSESVLLWLQVLRTEHSKGFLSEHWLGCMFCMCAGHVHCVAMCDVRKDESGGTRWHCWEYNLLYCDL